VTQHLDSDMKWQNQEDSLPTSSEAASEEAEYSVVVTPDAGVGVLEPVRVRRSPRAPRRELPLAQTVQASIRNSRAALKRHAVSCQLSVCMTLTYREITDNARADLEDFLEKVRHFYPDGFQWASVSETGSDAAHRPHHHVMLPHNSQLLKIAEQWHWGAVHVGINTSDKGIRRTVNYLSRHFRSVDSGVRRFRRSKGIRARVFRHRAASLESAQAVIESYLPAANQEVEVWNPRCAGRRIVYWETKKAQLNP